KLPLIEKYLKTADVVFVGGALYNNVLKSLKHEVGVSLIDADAPYVDAMVADASFAKKVFVPDTVVVKDVGTDSIREAKITDVHTTETIQDIATFSVAEFVKRIEEMKTKTILWNGPIGNFETEPFAKGTVELGQQLLAYAKNNADAQLLIGGGDTVSAIKNITELATQSNIFISTGGGAMLEFLENEGQLPGIVSLI
ncbi:MAG: phosphoglycerate kinase, partial [Patescibacteria group bacterium]